MYLHIPKHPLQVVALGPQGEVVQYILFHFLYVRVLDLNVAAGEEKYSNLTFASGRGIDQAI